MIVKVGKNDTYEVNFNHNTADKVGAVVIRKNNRFLTAGSATCGAKESYCKDCSRKRALANAFKNVGLKTISKETRWEFWETYRTTGTATPRWPQSLLKKGTKERELLQKKAEYKKEFSRVVKKGNAAYEKAKSSKKK